MMVGAVTDVGLIREINQDCLFAGSIEDFPLYIVADGMGGHNAGEIASSMAVDIIKTVFTDNRDNLISEENIIMTIEDAIIKANEKIFLQSKKFQSILEWVLLLHYAIFLEIRFILDM